MTKKLKEFKELFAEKLKDPDYAIEYLNETLADEDKSIFLVALKNVIEANSEELAPINAFYFYSFAVSVAVVVFELVGGLP